MTSNEECICFLEGRYLGGKCSIHISSVDLCAHKSLWPNTICEFCHGMWRILWNFEKISNIFCKLSTLSLAGGHCHYPQPKRTAVATFIIDNRRQCLSQQRLLWQLLVGRNLYQLPCPRLNSAILHALMYVRLVWEGTAGAGRH